ncbi:MAG TPA: cell division protein ZapE [Actinocrinis sp.]|uniref:cell division protein ZapE n=1 Tax=Actinocrinis sp. TaxID=1920516 RepID=UPI002D6F2AEE|nr:cell division protein ZapE [Actinocrinis sp.]HZU54771.1 cell division protein ZapE [Actinocrinis sp.]
MTVILSTQIPGRLAGRVPTVTPERLLAELVPPPRFASARFDTYVPDPNEPSQSAARDLLAAAAERPGDERRTPRFSARRLLGRGAGSPNGGFAAFEGKAGVYLDGGYGVGKTHLLASLWHATEGQKSYGTFVEYTNLVGALGFAACVARLATRELVCIDEFELDDPGDTVLISTLLTRLAEAGVRLAATSNTLPDRLGEGRFAAADFLREIQGLAARFVTLRIEGRDYRRREAAAAPAPASEADIAAFLDADEPGRVVDDFGELTDHLGTLHPSRYGALLDGVEAAALRGLRPIDDQNAALRLVVLVDRLYDRSIPVLASGVPVDRLFTPQLLAGGYRKKYLRATSRLVSLASAGAALVPARS